MFYCLNSKYTFKQRDWTKGKAYINPFSQIIYIYITNYWSTLVVIIIYPAIWLFFVIINGLK